MQFSQTSNHGLRLHLVLLLKCNDKFSFLNIFFSLKSFVLLSIFLMKSSLQLAAIREHY